MKTVASLVLLSGILAPGLVAQTKPPIDQNRGRAFQKQLFRDGVYATISTGVAEKLLVRKVDPALKSPVTKAHDSATVIVGFEIGKNGEVLHPTVLSEPAPEVVEEAVLEAVRQYKYKPYLLNGEAIVVETWVSVTVSDK
jgi:predicted naringenin-chalcone synthase